VVCEEAAGAVIGVRGETAFQAFFFSLWRGLFLRGPTVIALKRASCRGPGATAFWPASAWSARPQKSLFLP